MQFHQLASQTNYTDIQTKTRMITSITSNTHKDILENCMRNFNRLSLIEKKLKFTTYRNLISLLEPYIHSDMFQQSEFKSSLTSNININTQTDTNLPWTWENLLKKWLQCLWLKDQSEIAHLISTNEYWAVNYSIQ